MGRDPKIVPVVLAATLVAWGAATEAAPGTATPTDPAGGLWPAGSRAVGEAAVDAPGDGAARRRARQHGDGGQGFSLPGSRAGGPIHIDADVLEFDARQEVATFRGSVVTTQDDVVMRSGLLRVTFVSTDDGPGSLERLESVVAEGDVEIQQGDRVARGARAEFNDAERTVILTGGAVLHDGPSEVRGDRVVVYLDEERSVVEGRNTRVKAILVPDRSDGTEKQSRMRDTDGPQAAQPAGRADDAP